MSIAAREVLEIFVGKTWAWATVIPFYVVLLWPSILSALARRVRSEDQALLDGGFGEQFLVEVTIVVNDRRLGTDRGVLWFEDGLMGFSGRAASFVLASRDVRPELSPKKRKGKDPLPADRIALCGAPREAYVVVSPLGRQRRAYLAALKRFMWSKESPESERFWPPLRSYGAATREALTTPEAIGVEAARTGFAAGVVRRKP